MMDKRRIFYPILNNVIGFLTQRVWQDSILGTGQLADPPRIKKSRPLLSSLLSRNDSLFSRLRLLILTTFLAGYLDLRPGSRIASKMRIRSWWEEFFGSRKGKRRGDSWFGRWAVARV